MTRPLANVLVVVVGWAVIAAVFAVASSLTLMLTYQPPNWDRSIATAAAEWAPWAALTPVVTWLARRYRVTAARWWRSAIVLGSAGLAVVFVKLTLTRVLQSVGGTGDYIAITNVATQYFIYWGLIAGTYAFENYRENRARELTAAQLEAALSDARLQLLKMQLQPHFLFNTLNTIAEMVHENPHHAERMIAGLGVLLRETLDAGGADLIPLGRELELLERYVAIQQVRFGDRLRLQVDVAPDALAAAVPTLILQPLVENAIKHGIAARLDAGRITLRARRDGADLELRVEDDGPGFAPEPAERVGLTNTRGRLQALFGERHVFHVEAQDTGSIVTIRLPLVTAMETTR